MILVPSRSSAYEYLPESLRNEKTAVALTQQKSGGSPSLWGIQGKIHPEKAIDRWILASLYRLLTRSILTVKVHHTDRLATVNF